MLEETMLEQKVWAVVGVNQDPRKYGNMIYNKLKHRGYEVYAVNPNYEAIDGEKCYESLSSLPKLPEVVCMVVSPQRGLPIVREAARLGIRFLWLQPETYDDALLEAIDELGLQAVQACALVATR